jgi:hypothetical protein
MSCAIYEFPTSSTAVVASLAQISSRIQELNGEIAEMQIMLIGIHRLLQGPLQNAKGKKTEAIYKDWPSS